MELHLLRYAEHRYVHISRCRQFILNYTHLMLRWFTSLSASEVRISHGIRICKEPWNRRMWPALSTLCRTYVAATRLSDATLPICYDGILISDQPHATTTFLDGHFYRATKSHLDGPPHPCFPSLSCKGDIYLSHCLRRGETASLHIDCLPIIHIAAWYTTGMCYYRPQASNN